MFFSSIAIASGAVGDASFASRCIFAVVAKFFASGRPAFAELALRTRPPAPT